MDIKQAMAGAVFGGIVTRKDKYVKSLGSIGPKTKELVDKSYMQGTIDLMSALGDGMEIFGELKNKNK